MQKTRAQRLDRLVELFLKIEEAERKRKAFNGDKYFASNQLLKRVCPFHVGDIVLLGSGDKYVEIAPVHLKLSTIFKILSLGEVSALTEFGKKYLDDALEEKHPCYSLDFGETNACRVDEIETLNGAESFYVNDFAEKNPLIPDSTMLVEFNKLRTMYVKSKDIKAIESLEHEIACIVSPFKVGEKIQYNSRGRIKTKREFEVLDILPTKIKEFPKGALAIPQKVYGLVLGDGFNNKILTQGSLTIKNLEEDNGVTSPDTVELSAFLTEEGYYG